MSPTWLTENPLQPFLWGVLLTAFLGMLWFMLRKKAFLILSILALAVTIACVITERVIVTDREQITEAIFDMAECVRTNDAQGIIKHVKPSKTEFIERIRTEMAQYSFLFCHVIGFNEQSLQGNPYNSATFEFVVWVEGEKMMDRLPGKGNVRVTLEFEKNGDQWQLVAYDYVVPATRQRARQMKY